MWFEIWRWKKLVEIAIQLDYRGRNVGCQDRSWRNNVYTSLSMSSVNCRLSSVVWFEKAQQSVTYIISASVLKNQLRRNIFWGAGTAQWYIAGLWAGWLEVRVLAGAGNFSLYHHVQTGSGSHTFSYSVDTRSSFPAGKAAGARIWTLTSI
jgi:hypothetical protein